MNKTKQKQFNAIIKRIIKARESEIPELEEKLRNCRHIVKTYKEYLRLNSL